jgi:hypothetical protein
MPSPLPRQDRWEPFRSSLPIDVGFPLITGRSAPASLVSGPAQRSLSLRPANSPSHQRDPLHQRLQQFRHLHYCSDCYRAERTSSRAGLSPLWTSAFSRRTVKTRYGRFSLTTAPPTPSSDQNRHPNRRVQRRTILRGKWRSASPRSVPHVHPFRNLAGRGPEASICSRDQVTGITGTESTLAQLERMSCDLRT